MATMRQTQKLVSGAAPYFPPPAHDDPEFYCHGQRCIDGGCSPLLCKDSDPHDDPQPRT